MLSCDICSVLDYTHSFDNKLRDSILVSRVWKSHTKRLAPFLVAAFTPYRLPLFLSQDHRSKWLITDLHRAEGSHVYTYERGLSGGLKVSSFLKRIFRVPRATERYSVPPTSRCHFAARLYRARGLRKCSYEGWRGKAVVRGRLQARVVSTRVALRLAAAPFRSREIARYRRWPA